MKNYLVTTIKDTRKLMEVEQVYLDTDGTLTAKMKDNKKVTFNFRNVISYEEYILPHTKAEGAADYIYGIIAKDTDKPQIQYDVISEMLVCTKFEDLKEKEDVIELIATILEKKGVTLL